MAAKMKKCDKCGEAYKGFGTTCGTCRKKPADTSSEGAQGGRSDLCAVCGKKVYVMELLTIGGLTFHKDCFRCATCRRKLETDYRRSELGWFCSTHFAEIATVTGGYAAGTGPMRNALAKSLVDAIASRGGSGRGAAAEEQPPTAADAKDAEKEAAEAAAPSEAAAPAEVAAPAEAAAPAEPCGDATDGPAKEEPAPVPPKEAVAAGEASAAGEVVEAAA